MNHDPHDPWAQSRDYYPEDQSRRHGDRQGGQRSEASIEREIQNRADQASTDALQNQAIKDLKGELDSANFQLRHLIEEVANSKASAKAAELRAEDAMARAEESVKTVADIKTAFIGEASARGEQAREAGRESKEAKHSADIALRIAKDNRQDLRALGWVRDSLVWIWSHKGKIGTGTVGAGTVVGIIAKLTGLV